MRTCEVEGCNRKHDAKGYCKMHYLRVKKHGTTNPREKIDLRERFDGKYLAVPETGCWLWEGSCDTKGYGLLSKNGRLERAHRISWELHYGPIPEDMCVCHKCDVRTCVNPNHLFVGTQKDNIQDALKKQRLYLEGLKLGRMTRKNPTMKGGGN